MCNRGIYHKGWTAVTRHSIPWLAAETPPLDDDTWELYDTTTDWSQAHNLAAEHPDKLHRLQRLFLIEAVKYGALPLDDRRVERFLAELAGRPELITGSSQLLFGGMGRLSESSVINTKNTSHSVTADIEVSDGERSGVLHRPGGSLRRVEPLSARGRPYLLLQPVRHHPDGRPRERRPSTPATIRSGSSSPTTGGWAARPPSPCSSTVHPVGDGRLERTVPLVYSYDETTDVGSDTGSTVSDGV